jgi:hypothetical protein
MTPKPNGSRALGVKHPTYEAKLTISNFSLFYANAQCLMRHKVRLLGGKLKMTIKIFFF